MVSPRGSRPGNCFTDLSIGQRPVVDPKRVDVPAVVRILRELRPTDVQVRYVAEVGRAEREPGIGADLLAVHVQRSAGRAQDDGHVIPGPGWEPFGTVDDLLSGGASQADGEAERSPVRPIESASEPWYRDVSYRWLS